MQATTFMSRRPPPRAYDRSPHAAARFVKPADPPHSDLPFSFSCIDADPSALAATRFCVISQLVVV
jgi:hypothetical protein